MIKSNSVLTQINNVYRHCYNNCGTIKNPYRDHGVFRTDTMINCLDNRRRRVWCKANAFEYVLFVVMDSERVMLGRDLNKPIPFGLIEDLIV